MYATYSWLKGTIDENGKVTVPTPQLICQTESFGKVYNYYVTRMVKGVAPNEYTVVYEPDTEETNLYFIYKNGRLLQEETDIMVGLTDESGAWTKYGDTNIIALPIESELMKPADPSSLDMKTYSYSYDEGSAGGQIVELGIDGTTAWLHNITNIVDDCWVKGTVDGDKIIFPSKQFVGRSISNIDDHAPSYLTYFFGATTEAVWYESIGRYGYLHTLADDIVFTKDGNGVYSSPNTIIINLGDNGMDKLGEYRTPKLTPYVEIAAVPKLPEIIDYSQYKEADYCGFVRFSILPESENGLPINPSKIYYNLFLDTTVPYALTTEDYPLLPVKSITDITYDFNDGTAIYRNGNYFTFVFYPQGLTRIGVEAFYTGGDVTNHTDISWVNLETGEKFTTPGIGKDVGVEDVVADNDEIESYYDLMGRKIPNPANGVYIAMMKSGKAVKVVVNK